MSILSDKTIKKLTQEKNMITNFSSQQVKKNDSGNILSYGLSSYGYDARCDYEIYVFQGRRSDIVDPKRFNRDMATRFYGKSYVMAPNCYILARTIESFNIPADVMGICMGKSTYARCGIMLNTTPLEPEWSGHITLEIANVSPFNVQIYLGEGICQVIFIKGDSPCDITYKDREGKYQDQKDVTFAKV